MDKQISKRTTTKPKLFFRKMVGMPFNFRKSNFEILRYAKIRFVKDVSIFVLYFLRHFGNS